MHSGIRVRHRCRRVRTDTCGAGDVQSEARFLRASVSEAMVKLRKGAYHELRIGSWEEASEGIGNIGHVLHHPEEMLIE